MFQRIYTVAMYSSDLQASVARHQALGLEVAWTDEVEGRSKVGMRCPQGGAEFILHNDVERQFPELTVAVADIHRVYNELQREPGYLWFEPPHPTKHGCAAFVRTPDGNVLSLLSPGCDCDERTSSLQASPAAADASQEEPGEFRPLPLHTSGPSPAPSRRPR